MATCIVHLTGIWLCLLQHRERRENIAHLEEIWELQETLRRAGSWACLQTSTLGFNPRRQALKVLYHHLIPNPERRGNAPSNTAFRPQRAAACSRRVLPLPSWTHGALKHCTSHVFIIFIHVFSRWQVREPKMELCGPQSSWVTRLAT